MKKISCLGMLVCDISLSPIPNDVMEKDASRINPPVYSCGGDALNVAISLNKLGLEVSISGWVGNDINGDYLISQCKHLEIDTSNIIIDDQSSTAVSYVLIDENGERHFLSENSIFSKMVFDDVNLNAIQKSDFVYFGSAIAMSSMNNGGLAALFKTAHQMGKITVLDAAINDNHSNSNWLKILSSAFAETDIFFPSYSEAVLLTNEKDPEAIAECFRDYGMKAFGIKLGSKGCYVTDFQNSKYIPGVENVEVIDTTGAGDSFMAGLICGLANDLNIFRSAEFANTVAALNVARLGATSGVPDYTYAKKYIDSINETGDEN